MIRRSDGRLSAFLQITLFIVLYKGYSILIKVIAPIIDNNYKRQHNCELVLILVLHPH